MEENLVDVFIAFLRRLIFKWCPKKINFSFEECKSYSMIWKDREVCDDLL